jgi:hypothetical protein
MIGLVNNKLERLWKEAVMALFEVLPQALSGGTDEENQNPLSKKSMSWPRSKLSTYRSETHLFQYHLIHKYTMNIWNTS